MKKIIVFIVAFLALTNVALALEIRNASDAYDDIYGFVRPGDEIDWDRFWYYLYSDGEDSDECVNVKIILTNGLSFSKTEKVTIKDLGRKCGSNQAGPVLNVPPPANLVDKIYVSNNATPGYKKITVQFGDEIIDYDIYFLVMTDDTSNELLSNNSAYIDTSQEHPVLRYNVYDPERIYYILFDGKLIDYDYINYIDNYDNPSTSSNICYKCAPNYVDSFEIDFSFLNNLELGNHTVEFVSDYGEVVTARIAAKNQTTIKLYNTVDNGMVGAGSGYVNCINRDNKFVFDNVENINEFSELKINDQTILKSNYTATVNNGKIEIILKKDFVANLDIDEEYTLKAKFTYGAAVAPLNLSYCDSGDKIEILSGKSQILNLKNSSKSISIQLYTPKNYNIKKILLDGSETLTGLPNTMDIPNPSSNSGYTFNCDSGLCSEYELNFNNIISETGRHTITFIGSDGSVKNTYLHVINSSGFQTKKYNALITGTPSYCGNNGIKFTIDTPYQVVSGITINDQPVLESSYTTTDLDGQMEVSLKKELTSTLTPGEYNLKITFEDGNAIITFRIKDTETCEAEALTTYNVTDGANQVVNLNKSKTIQFKINADLEKFVAVYVNNKVVDKSNYKLTKGSTIITFNETYTQKLENGKYDVRIEFTDGSASTTFVVNTAEVDNPHTGASISIAVLGLAVIGYVLIKTNKKKLYNI